MQEMTIPENIEEKLDEDDYFVIKSCRINANCLQTKLNPKVDS